MSDTDRADTGRLTVFGLNHNTAPLEIRERIYLQGSAIPDFLGQMRAIGIDESVVISTCNRTEIYFCTGDNAQSSKRLGQMLSVPLGTAPAELSKFTYTFHDSEAIRHLFIVASGLDSLVIGEPEILGQVKEAYRIASQNRATGPFLNKIFHKAFNAAKRIRTETKIGYNPLSISSMAIELAKRIFGDLREKKILVVGAGEMCEVALKYFQKEGLTEVLITNRTYQNACRLAEDIMGRAYPFEELAELVGKVDMVLTSTGSEAPLIDEGFIRAVMKKRKQRPLFLIDIAVPRDIAPGVNSLENVYLYDIDDLKELSQQHLSDRMRESEKARAIVDEEVATFGETLRQLDLNPLITHVLAQAEAMRLRELKKAVQKLKNIDAETMSTFDALTRTITNRLIHPHIALIKENSSDTMLEALKRCFRFEEEDEKELDNRNKGQ